MQVLGAVDLRALGAFLSGAAAVFSSIWAIRSLRKRYRAECDQRVEEVRRSIHEGYEMRDHEKAD